MVINFITGGGTSGISWDNVTQTISSGSSSGSIPSAEAVWEAISGISAPIYDQEISSASTSGRAPSSKAVWEALEKISVSGVVYESALTSAITSASTSGQVPTAKAVWDALNNIKVSSAITQEMSGKPASVGAVYNYIHDKDEIITKTLGRVKSGVGFSDFFEYNSPISSSNKSVKDDITYLYNRKGVIDLISAITNYDFSGSVPQTIAVVDYVEGKSKSIVKSLIKVKDNVGLSSGLTWQSPISSSHTSVKDDIIALMEGGSVPASAISEEYSARSASVQAVWDYVEPQARTITKVLGKLKKDVGLDSGFTYTSPIDSANTSVRDDIIALMAGGSVPASSITEEYSGRVPTVQAVYNYVEPQMEVVTYGFQSVASGVGLDNHLVYHSPISAGINTVRDDIIDLLNGQTKVASAISETYSAMVPSVQAVHDYAMDRDNALITSLVNIKNNVGLSTGLTYSSPISGSLWSMADDIAELCDGRVHSRKEENVGVAVKNILKLTQAEYTALDDAGKLDPTTLYLIKNA